MVTISVIIPVFNDEENIQAAVDSALKQQKVSVEVIVVDDGSTDKTLKILNQYGKKIRLLSQGNSGVIAARNNGARLAKGDWIAFLDSDDEWLPEKLLKQLPLAVGNVVMVYTSRQNIGDSQRVDAIHSHYVTSHQENVFELLLLDNFITTSSVIMRRDWFEKLGGFDKNLLLCEDWDLWLRVLINGGGIAACLEPLTLYRWRSDSLTRNHQRMNDSRLMVIQKALDSPLGKTLGKKIKKRAIANALLCSAWYAMETQPKESLKWSLKAAVKEPLNILAYKQVFKSCLQILSTRVS